MARINEANRKLYSERLLTLANLMLALEPHQYKHYNWVGKYTPKNLCNTTACAFGWAAVDKKLFPDLPVFPVNHGTVRNPSWVLETKEDPGGECAERQEAEKYFGPGSYDELFSGMAWLRGAPRTRGRVRSLTHPTPDLVAERIENFVREKYGYERA